MELRLPQPSLHLLFRNAYTQIKRPEDIYLWEKKSEAYTPITYAYMVSQVNAIAAWLYVQGIRKGDKVALITDNCPEYFYIDQAIQYLGAVNVSIYPTLSEGEAAYILNDSGASIVFTGSSFLHKKILRVKQECPRLREIVKMFPDDSKSEKDLTRIVGEGAPIYEQYRDTLEEILHSIVPDDLAALIYTSGTTGIPKGVMLSHANFLSNTQMAIELIPELYKTDRFLSFLPLSHVYERLVTYYLGLFLGAEVAFAQSIDTIAANIQEIRPTIVACVPRLLERVQDRIWKNAEKGGAFKFAIFKLALKNGERRRKALEKGKQPGLSTRALHTLMDKLVYHKIRERLGGRMRILVSGGGPLSPFVAEFFSNLGILVLEGYGLTETSPFICVNEYSRQVIGTVGRVAPYNTVAIKDPDTGALLCRQDYESFDPAYESEEGEICVIGPNIMKGYWNKPEETDAVFDREGWFHTGDIGKFHKGNLKITDRLKNMIVNAYGKNIYPSPVEAVYLKSQKIEQIFLIGDKREYITAIITPSPENIKQSLHLGDEFFEHPETFVKDEKVMQWLEEDIKKLSGELSKFERIKSFIVKRKPFSIEAGELTPTLKAKRQVIENKYAEEIEQMYKEG